MGYGRKPAPRGRIRTGIPWRASAEARLAAVAVLRERLPGAGSVEAARRHALLRPGAQPLPGAVVAAREEAVAAIDDHLRLAAPVEVGAQADVARRPVQSKLPAASACVEEL